MDSHKQHLLDNPHKTPGAGNTTKPKVNKTPIMHRLKVGAKQFFRKHGGKVAAGTAIAGLAIPAGIEIHNHIKSAEQTKGKTMNDLQQYLSIVANEIQGFGAYNVTASKARKPIDLRTLSADDLSQMAGTTPKEAPIKKPVKDFRKKKGAAATVNDVPKINKVQLKSDPKGNADFAKYVQDKRAVDQSIRRQNKKNKKRNKNGGDKSVQQSYKKKTIQERVPHHNAQPNPKFRVADEKRKLFDGSTQFPRKPKPEPKEGMFKRAGKFLAKHKGKAALGAAGTGALGYIGYRSYRNGRDS